MSVETYKRLKRENYYSPSYSPISTYSSSNVPIFSPKRKMALSKEERDRRYVSADMTQTVALYNDSIALKNSFSSEIYQSGIFGNIKDVLVDTGKLVWAKLTGSMERLNVKDARSISESCNLEDPTVSFVDSLSRKHKSPEYFIAPRKLRRLASIESAPTSIAQDVSPHPKLHEQHNNERLLSFSRDPFNWNTWKTTKITSAVNDTGVEMSQYGTTLRVKRRNNMLESKHAQLALRTQSEEIEYLKMIFNGEYKVPKMIEDEREEQMKLMQVHLAGNQKVKKSIVDLTERIRNILLDNADRKQANDDDIIFIKESKVSPLDKKRKEFQNQQLRFDRSLLEFDKEFKTYRQLLEERKLVQEQVRKKIEQTEGKKLIPSISTSEIKVVQKTLARQENAILMNKDNLEVSVRDFKTLTPRRWLNDTVIEFFMKFVEKSTEKTVAFNSFFYTNLSERGYQGVRRWMKRKKSQIGDLDKIFIPINLNQSHWALGMIDITRKRIVYVDSLSNGPNAMSFAILNDLKKYVIEESKNAMGADFELENLPCPQQPNGFDCGIYLCMNTLYLSHDSSLAFDQKDAIRMRTYIGHLILSEGA